MDLRRFFRKSESGQALAEYIALIPPVLLVTTLITLSLSERIGDVYCEMVNTLRPDACVVAEAAEAEPEEEVCVPLQEEQGGSQCAQSEDCDLLPGLNNGSYTSTSDIESFVIKAGRDYHMYFSGVTDDGCYYVNIDANHVSWNKVGSGPQCKDVSHTQSWNIPLCP